MISFQCCQFRSLPVGHLPTHSWWFQGSATGNQDMNRKIKLRHHHWIFIWFEQHAVWSMYDCRNNINTMPVSMSCNGFLWCCTARSIFNSWMRAYGTHRHVISGFMPCACSTCLEATASLSVGQALMVPPVVNTIGFSGEIWRHVDHDFDAVRSHKYDRNRKFGKCQSLEIDFMYFLVGTASRVSQFIFGRSSCRPDFDHISGQCSVFIRPVMPIFYSQPPR